MEELADQASVAYGQQSSALRALTTVKEQADQAGAHTLGGLRADSPLGRGATLQERMEQGQRGVEDFYEDLREYIRLHEMPPESRPESLASRKNSWDIDQEPTADEKWLANRTWGRAIQIKQDHLRQKGVTERPYAEAMWDWKDQIERQARRLQEPLAFSPKSAGREPYLARVYRGDSRPSDVIFSQGFSTWRTMHDKEGTLTPHDDRAGDRGDTSDLVWTSKDSDTAAYKPNGTPREHVYVLRDAPHSLDMNNEYGPDYGAYDSNEVTFEGDYPADKVEGELIDRDDPSAGIVPNPAFKPYEPTPLRPPREDGD